MRYLTLLIVLLFETVSAQSVSVSPISFLAWGRSVNTALAEVEYKNVSLIYLHALKDDVDYEGNRYHGGFAGIFYTPINIGEDFYSKGSVGYFHRKFPTEIGQRLHFRFQLGYSFGKLAIEASHVSNGFGLFGNFNTGVDNVSIRYSF